VHLGTPRVAGIATDGGGNGADRDAGADGVNGLGGGGGGGATTSRGGNGGHGTVIIRYSLGAA
jgi:hypothetical protein